MPDAGPFPVPPGGMNPDQPRYKKRRRARKKAGPEEHSNTHYRKLRRRKKTGVAGTG